MKHFLRQQFEQRAPGLLNYIRAVRNRRYFRQRFSSLHATVRKQLFPNDARINVQRGPFKGLHYFDEAVWGSITPRWLGSYEAELHAIIDHIGKKDYVTIIDVGCAEGYYAVGLAVMIPTAKVTAFDTDFISRNQVRRLAQLNGVAERIQIRTFCDHSDLDTLSNGNTLVISDIEGFEAYLLDPQKSATLYQNDILVEIHEIPESPCAVEQLLNTRFSVSHTIQRITSTNRDSWIAENRRFFASSIPDDVFQNATDESRDPGQVWLWIQASRG